WTPEVVVSRHNGLYRNLTSEIQTARLVRVLGPARTEEGLNLRPRRPRPQPDPGPDLSPISERALALFQGSRDPLRFEPGDVRPEYRREASRSERDPTAPAVVSRALWDDPSLGSNNWIVSGERTFSRAPLMVNDPHRPILLPSLRYWV